MTMTILNEDGGVKHHSPCPCCALGKMGEQAAKDIAAGLEKLEPYTEQELGKREE